MAKNKRKSSGKIILTIIAIILIIGVLGSILFFAFKVVPEELAITPSCSQVNEDGDVREVEFSCPIPFLCRATPFLECNQQGEQQIVLARTDDFDYGNGWLAYNRFEIEGGLVSYKKEVTSRGSCTQYADLCDFYTNRDTIEVIDLPLDFKGALCDTGEIIVPNTGEDDYACSGGYERVVRYTQGGNADTSSDTSDCDALTTRCIGGANYICQENIILNNQVIKTLTYAKDSSSPPAEPERGLQYSPSSSPQFESGDTMRFSKMEVEIWTCPEQVTECQTSCGTTIQLGDEMCSCQQTNIIENCITDDSGNAVIDQVQLSGACCVDDLECTDLDETTIDVCVQNTCLHNPVAGSCNIPSDCDPFHQDWECNNNLCEFPTTGIYCSSAQAGDTRCSNSILETCLPVEASGVVVGFSWQFSENCSTAGEVCAE